MSDWRKDAVEIDGTGRIQSDWMKHAIEVPHDRPDSGSSGQTFIDRAGNILLGGYGPQVIEGASRAFAPVYDKLTGSHVADHLGDYVTSRDATIKKFEQESRDNPTASALGTGAGVVGSILMPAGAAAKGATLMGKIGRGAIAGGTMGALVNPGDVEGELSPLQLKDRAKGLGYGAAFGALVPTAVGLGGKLASKASGALTSGAEHLAENATGATAVGAEKFKDGTGRFLLDNKVVTFGADPKRIAANANSAIEAAEAAKQGAINGELAGANVDRNQVYNAIKAKIDSLRGDESQTGLVKQLEAKLDDIVSAADHSGSELPLANSEKVRRGFDKNAKWDSNSDAPTRDAAKIAANIYREAGESVANATSPEAGAIFKGAKTTQSTLIPVAEAAERRAAQLRQSPHGGLLSAAHGGAGGIIGGMLGGPAGAAVGIGVGMANKALRGRYASMGAIGADALAGKLANVAQSAKRANPYIGSLATQGISAAQAGIKKSDDPILNDTRLMGVFKQDPSLIDLIEDEDSRAKVARAVGANREPSTGTPKGEDKWAQDGANKLGLSADDTQQITQNKELKRLLIEASDMPVGSPALKRIKDLIQKGMVRK